MRIYMVREKTRILCIDKYLMLYKLKFTRNKILFLTYKLYYKFINNNLNKDVH